MIESRIHTGKPLVSVVTPSFNQGQFIEENLRSVQSQSYSNIEHIVIDGGSEDNTVEILKKWEGLYTLVWVSEHDEGHADAVNKGCAIARGDIIGWLNSDDVYFDRDAIGAVVEAFQKHPNADIVYGDVAYIWEDGTILRIQCVPGFRYNRLLRGCFLEQPGVFFRRHVVEEHKLDKRLKVAIDYEYWLRIGKLCRFWHIPRIVAADRNHRDRISIAQSDKLKAVAKELRRRYLGRPSLWLRVVWQSDKLISGVPRRLKGLITLLRLRQKNDFAFDAKVVVNRRTIRNQLFPPGVERLQP